MRSTPARATYARTAPAAPAVAPPRSIPNGRRGLRTARTGRRALRVVVVAIILVVASAVLVTRPGPWAAANEGPVLRSSPRATKGRLDIPVRRIPNTGRQHPTPEQLEHEAHEAAAAGRELATPFKDFTFTRRESDGVYWADIRIGTPPQTFSVIVDSGSATIAVPAKGCHCGNSHHYYDIAASSTAEDSKTQYRQCYSEGSCNTGTYVSDRVCIGENCPASESILHAFGSCSTYARAFQQQDADGIMGMSGADSTLIADLRAHHELEEDIFAMCFGKEGGVLSVGGFSDAKHLEPLQWIPMEIHGTFYKVKVSGLFLGGKQIGSDNLGLNPIVDSGTTFTYLPADLFGEMRTAWDEYCAQDPENRCLGEKNPTGTPHADARDALACYQPPSDGKGGYLADERWIKSFPDLQIGFASGQKVCIPALSYLFVSSGKLSVFCVGALRSTRFVIGAITMSDFNVVFDHGRSRIGWARADCDGNAIPDISCCGGCSASQGSVPSESPTELSPESRSPTSFARPTKPPSPKPLLNPPAAPAPAAPAPAPGTAPAVGGQGAASEGAGGFWQLDPFVIGVLFVGLGVVVTAAGVLLVCCACVMVRGGSLRDAFEEARADERKRVLPATTENEDAVTMVVT